GPRVALADQDYTVTVASTQQQTTQINTAFAEAPLVRVCVGLSFPCQGVSGVNVKFTAPASGASGTFSTTGTNTVTVVSSGNGTAQAPTFTANGIAGGPYSMDVRAQEANAADAVPNFFFFTNSANPAS